MSKQFGMIIHVPREANTNVYLPRRSKNSSQLRSAQLAKEADESHMHIRQARMEPLGFPEKRTLLVLRPHINSVSLSFVGCESFAVICFAEKIFVHKTISS
jgi:hypothetical protein